MPVINVLAIILRRLVENFNVKVLENNTKLKFLSVRQKTEGPTMKA